MIGINASSITEKETLAIALDIPINLENPNTVGVAGMVSKFTRGSFQHYCDISSDYFDTTSEYCITVGDGICETVTAPLKADIGGIGAR